MTRANDPRFDPAASPQLEREALAGELLDQSLPDEQTEHLTPKERAELRRRVDLLEKHPDLAVVHDDTLDEDA